MNADEDATGVGEGGPTTIAVLDERRIEVTNEEWRRFVRDGPDGWTLDVAAIVSSDGGEEESARLAEDGVRAVLAGDSDQFVLEYACDGSGTGTERCHELFAVRVGGGDGANATVVLAHADVSERVASRLDVERYETVLRNVPIVLFVLDGEGTVVHAEGKGLEAIDLEGRDAVGESVFERYADNPDVVDGCRRALSGESVRAVHEMNGRVFETAYFPQTDGTDSVERVVGVALDVTRRVRNEETLAALSDFLRSLLDARTAGEVCETAVEGAELFLDLPMTVVALYEESVGELRPRARTWRAENLPEGVLDGEEGIAWDAFVESEPKFAADLVAIPLGKHGVFVSATSGKGAIDRAKLCASDVEAALDRTERERRLREQESTLQRKNAALERLETLNESIRRVDRALVEARSRAEIERAVCTRLATAGPYRFVWIGEVDPVDDAVVPREWAGVERGYLDAVSVLTNGEAEAQGPTGAAIRTGTPQVVQDILRNPPYEPWRREALKRGYRSSCALPLRYGDAVYGVLNVYADRTDAFDDLERGVLEDVSKTVAYAINAMESKKALTGGGVVELAFDVRDPDIAFVAIPRKTGGPLEFAGIVSKPDGSLQAFFTVDGPSAERVCNAATESLEITGIDHVSDRNGENLFAATLADRSFVATLVDHGGVPVSFVSDGESGQVVVRLAGDADVRTFVETVKTRYPESELRSQRRPERSIRTRRDFAGALTERLTDRQREVLETAYYSGFFESPRKSTGEEIGRSLGIAQPTFQQHLRVAERKLLGLLFERRETLDR